VAEACAEILEESIINKSDGVVGAKFLFSFEINFRKIEDGELPVQHG
jgi:hypothetical protein